MSEYLSMLAGREPNGYLEVRWAIDRGMAQRFFPTTQLAAAQNHINTLAARTDTFVGVCPRTHKSGGKKAIDHSWVLWVDIDHADWEQRASLAPVAPSLIVSSGTGAHLYWALTRPAPATMVEWANRRLAHLVGGDLACTDVSRILRPPGSWNHKSTPPRPVSRVGGHQRLVSMLIVADLPDPKQHTRPAKHHTKREMVGGSDKLRGISALEYAPRLTGREPNSRGMIRCPFHGGGQERTPSLKLYSDAGKGWWCFGCQKGGTAIDMAAELWGMETRGAEFVALKERLEGALL